MKKQLFVLATGLMFAAPTSFARDDDDPTRPGRSTAAGILTEALEHAVRTLEPAAFDQVRTASGTVADDKQSATVTIGLSDGTTRNFTCQAFEETRRGGSETRIEVVCRSSAALGLIENASPAFEVADRGRGQGRGRGRGRGQGRGRNRGGDDVDSRQEDKPKKEQASGRVA